MVEKMRWWYFTNNNFFLFNFFSILQIVFLLPGSNPIASFFPHFPLPTLTDLRNTGPEALSLLHDTTYLYSRFNQTRNQSYLPILENGV